MDHFRYVVEGSIGPDSFRVSELLSLIEKLEQAIAIEAGIRAGESEKQSPIRIISLKQGSFDFEFKTVDHFDVGARKVLAAYRRNDSSELKPASIRLLRNVQQKFVDHGAKTFRVFHTNGEVSPVVSWPADWILPEPSPDQFFYGETQLKVVVIRIGGMGRPTAKVKVLDTGRDMTIRLEDQKQALAFKEYLYKEVIVSGSARWDRDWDLYQFDVAKIEPSPGSAVSGFAAILNHFGGGIDFDPDSDLMRRITGEAETEEASP